MKTTDKLHAKVRDYSKKLEQYADRIWYPPLVAFLAALDNLIIIIPNDGLLIASSMLVPRRWAIFALSVSIGSTIGALTLCAIVEYQGLPWILDFYPDINQTAMWMKTEDFFGRYGLLVVFAISATPLSQQPILILAALANTPFAKLVPILFAGRFLKFMLMAYLGSHSPRLLKKMWGVKNELKDAGIKVD